MEDRPSLTKRELFAAMAMQGILSDPNSNAPRSQVKDFRIAVAKCAVEFADALIIALNESPK